MQASKRTSLTYIGLFALLAAVSGFSSGQAKSPVTRELVWSFPESEIASPQFSADGNFIVLVSRVHWPDGYEAESLPQSFFTKLEARKRRDPRFADPIIRLIDVKGNQVCEVRYGTNPTIAEDNKSIAFSRQRKPITGTRTLAETQAGNDIQVFDCEKKEARTIAEPTTGFFDNPILLPDGHSLAYTVNEAVNGAMGGSVGIDRVDMNGEHKESILAKEITPAIPCPPANPAKATQFQIMMCSQETKLSSSFQTLTLKVEMAGDQLLALQAKPIASVGDMYLASHYALNLLSVFPKMVDVFSMGQGDMNSVWDSSFEPISEGTVMIFAGYWKPFSLESKGWLPETAHRNANRRSIYSPNGMYYIAAEPVKEEPSRFTLYRAADGQRLFTSPILTGVYDLAWSKDSRKFAVVGQSKQASVYRDNLYVYSVR